MSTYTPRVQYLYGTGRRKSSSAKVKLFANGTGKMTINGRDLNEYFGIETYELIVNQPFAATKTEGQYDVVVEVMGGGLSGQAGAIRLGISRALLEANNEYRPLLKCEKLLTRDPRMKERKKYGLKSARRAPQFSKR